MGNRKYMQINYTKVSNCKVESLGIQEIDVYDLEMEDNHNFFANNILVHNTDSVYLNVDPLVKAACNSDNIVTWLDKVGKTKFQEQINHSIDWVARVGNCYAKTMDMKREAIASKSIWTAKKRYAMMVHNSEGVDFHPYKLKIMGLDLIKSSTPLEIRKKLKEALVVIFEKDQEALYDYVEKFKHKFMSMPIEDISFPRSVTDLDKYKDNVSIYGPKTPIAVRGALMYNHMNKNNKDIIKIKNGDKVKFVYLLMPNPSRENVISYPSYDKFPGWLDLDAYVDKDTQWEKVFIAPLKGICDVIGWHPEKVASLEDFFA